MGAHHHGFFDADLHVTKRRDDDEMHACNIRLFCLHFTDGHRRSINKSAMSRSTVEWVDSVTTSGINQHVSCLDCIWWWQKKMAARWLLNCNHEEYKNSIWKFFALAKQCNTKNDNPHALIFSSYPQKVLFLDYQKQTSTIQQTTEVELLILEEDLLACSLWH